MSSRAVSSVVSSCLVCSRLAFKSSAVIVCSALRTWLDQASASSAGDRSCADNCEQLLPLEANRTAVNNASQVDRNMAPPDAEIRLEGPQIPGAARESPNCSYEYTTIVWGIC